MWNLPLSGTKPQLLERLKKGLADRIPIGNNSKSKSNNAKTKTSERGKKPAGMASFAEGAYWEPLIPDTAPIVEPINNIDNARAPAIPEEDGHNVPVKYDFSKNKFAVPAFSSKVKMPARWSNGAGKKNKDGSAMEEEIELVSGCADPEFMKKHKINESTGPEEYSNLLLPFGRNMLHRKERVSFVHL